MNSWFGKYLDIDEPGWTGLSIRLERNLVGWIFCLVVVDERLVGWVDGRWMLEWTLG